MKYKVLFSDDALEDLRRLQRNEPQSYRKVQAFIVELSEHPRTGTGHPEQLKGVPKGRWSRQITKKHRMVYQIFDNDVVVLVLSSYGHYDDK